MTPRPNGNVYASHQDPFQILLSQKQEEELQSESSRGESLLPSDDPFLYSASSDARVDLEFALSFNNSRSRSNLLSRSNHQTHPQSSSLLEPPRISRHHSSSSSSSISSSSNTSTSTAISVKTVKQLHNSLLNPLAQARLSTNPTPISPAPAITLNSTSAISSSGSSNLSISTTSSKKSFSLDYLERFKDDPLVEEDTDRRPVSLYSPITVTNSQSSSSTTRSNTTSLLPSIDHETRSIDFNKVRSLKDSKRGILFSGEKIKSKSSWSEIQKDKDKGKEKEKEQVGIEVRDKKIGKQVQSLQPSDFGSSSNSASTSLPDSNRIRKKKDLSLINPQDRDNLFISNSLAKAFEKSRSLIENENQKVDLKSQPSNQSPVVEASKSLPTISTSDLNLKDQSEPNPSEESTEMDPGLGIVGMKTDPNLESNSNGNETKQSSGSIRRPSFAFWERARKLSSTNDTSNRGRSNSSVSNKNKDGNGSKVMTRDTSESSSSPEFIVRSVDGRRKSMERFESNKTNPIGTIGSGSGIENSKIRIGLGLDSELQEREKEIGFSSSSNEDEILSSNSSLHTNPLIRTASSSSSSNSSLGPSDSRNGHKNRTRGETLPSNINPIGLESEINDGNDDTSKKDLRSRSASTSTFRINNSNTPSSLLSQDGRESIMSNNNTSSSNSTLTPSSNLNNSKHIHLHRSALAIERYNQDDEILTLLNDGKEYSSDSDDDLHFSLDSNLAFAKQSVGSSQSHSHHTRSQSEDRGSTPTKDNSIKDLARVKRRRKLLKNQINIARKAKDSIQSEQDSKSSNGVSGRRRSASSVATTSSSLSSSANSSRSNRRSSVTGNMSLRETEEEDGGIKGGDEAEIGERRRRDRSNTVAGAVAASSIPKGDNAAASPSKTSKSLQEEFEDSSQTKSNSSLTVESFGRSDGTYTPSLISSAEDDSFYDANERGSGTSSSASNRSETEDQPVAVVDDQQQSLHKDEQNLISANHGLRSSRRKFNTSTSNAITPPIGLGIEQNPGTQSNIDDIEDEDEEDEDGNPTLNRKKTISPMVYVANSSATLRQDAIARDPPSSSIHSVPSSRSSSYDTQESYGSIKKSSTLNPISTSYSSMSSPSPSFSPISSTASQNYSPISSASSSSFSPNIPVVSTPSSSKMFIRSPSLRGSRIVPPLKPSPTSPLPPPPPNFNSIAGSTPSRPLSGISLLSSDNQVTKERTQKNQEMDAVVLKLKNLGKELGGKGIGRSRSQSLGQASENLVLDDNNRLSSLRSPSEIYRNKEGSSSTFISPPALSRTTSTDSSSRRNRSSSHIPPSLNLHGSMTNPIPSPLSTSRPRPLASTTEETEPSKSTSSDEKSATSSSSTPTSASSLDRGGTIRGRPRGATVGAVPYSGSNHHPSSRISVQTRSRPRSLLSNEILIPDSVRAEWDREEKEKASQGSNLNSSENSISPPNRVNSSNSIASTSSTSRSFGDDYLSSGNVDTSASTSASATGGSNSTNSTSSPAGSTLASNSTGAGAGNGTSNTTTTNGNTGSGGGGSSERSRSGSNSNGSGNAGGNASGSGRDREGGGGGRSRSGSNASLLQQVQHPPKSHASFVIAVVGHRGTGKSTVIKKGLRQFGLSKPNVLSEKVTSHSTVCVVDQEQRTIEVLEIDASVLLNAPGKRFAWPKFLPRIDAVILCYDAGQISSFRGMSELLDNFAQGHLSTVMLACKSEIFPKQVDPYYASDMAAVYNVGLAECTVQSEEGKKRMRDCFSYLVKEVAKARAGRQRKANASPHQPSSREREMEKDKERTKDASLDRRNRAGSGSSAAANSNASASGNPTGDLDGGSSVSVHSASSSHGSHSSTRDRNNSGASSTVESVPSAASYSSSGVPYSEEHTATIAQQQQHFQNQSRSNEALSESERYRNIRKMSDATTASDAPSFPESNSEEDHAVQQSISKAQLGLQSAQSVGGYVSIDELWDKFFFAAVSGNDERFLLMFMVFYRGFAKPIDLLRQLIERFDKLAMSERSDGVMIRFSLMRLTNMLGEWVQDYPGDLSGPETYPVVCSFYQKLLQHPSTVHVASPLQPHIEACRYAPDVDAVWSKAEDSDKPQSVAADVAPISTMINPELSGSATSLPKPPSTKSVNSSSSVPSVNSPPPPLPGQEEGSEGNTRSRGQSDASSFGPPVDNAHLSPKPIETRHRSASDVTSSSSDGIRGPQSNAGSVVTASSASIAPSTVSSNPTMDRSPSEQKTFLRGVSNALGELDDEAIAGELTRLEWNLFTTIRPRDLLRHILVARDLREKNGPVARSIAHFNYVSFWVCSMILVQGKTKHRAKMLEKFMNVAAILRRDNNYNTLHSVLAGLGNASIHRLKHTRELLNGKPVIKTYQSLARLMGSDRSFAAYRLALENSENRTIPYLGVHLQDILSMSDGNPSKRASDGMVHWRKFSLMDEAVMAIVKCQQHDRPTRPNPAVERLIMDLPVMDEETLYQRSLEVEPRSSQPSKIKKLMMQGTAS